MSNRQAMLGLVLLLFAGTSPGSDTSTEKAARTGEFELVLTLTEAAGAKLAEVASSVILPDEKISWKVYVPDNYRPEKPAGLLVYISPSPAGDIPRRWKPIMEQRNLIWIAARHSGNRVKVARRIIYALVAPTLMARDYSIDQQRIYMSGLSGGGRVASRLAVDYPQLFKGAIYNCGANFWDQQPPARLDLLQQNYYVFLTGTNDFAREPTKKVHRQYIRAGVKNSKLMVIRNMGHRNPDRADFDRAIEYIDTRAADPGPPVSTSSQIQ